jgi:hypothetical protein
MADLIGVARKWWQSPAKTSGSHYDIALSKRAIAVKHGAVEITVRQAAAMNSMRRSTGQLGDPETAWEWLMTDMARRRSATAEIHTTNAQSHGTTSTL